jgi:hypothetical protein
VTAGTAFAVTVTALDAFGNVATGYRGTVHFTSSDPSAVLPGDYPFASTDRGQHTFMVTLNSTGTRTVTATDTTKPTITGTATVTVNPHPDFWVVGPPFPPVWQEEPWPGWRPVPSSRRRHG